MSPDLLQLALGATSAGVVALLSGRSGLLKPSGAWAAFALGTVVFGLGGLPWSVPLLAFFLPASLLSKLSPHRRRRERELTGLMFEKGSTRDAGQVLANGGVAGLLVLVNAIAPHPDLFMAYLGALAAAAADTWGTEVGVLGGGTTWSVKSLRRVERGTSGGISVTGTLGATIGALILAVSGALRTAQPLRTIAIVVAAGLAGMLADSLAGAWVQGIYRCQGCGTATERRHHCGRPTVLVAGYRWMGNDLVNVVCCAAGATAAGLG